LLIPPVLGGTLRVILPITVGVAVLIVAVVKLYKWKLCKNRAQEPGEQSIGS